MSNLIKAPKAVVTMAFAASLALGGCYNTLSPDQQLLVGGAAGAGAGLLAADLLDANKNWTIVAALAGAATGSMVARNNQTQQCAYSNGRGGYYQAPC